MLELHHRMCRRHWLRAAAGMKPVAEALPDAHSTFLRRQPEHVELAGALGLGEWNREKIDHRKVRLS